MAAIVFAAAGAGACVLNPDSAPAASAPRAQVSELPAPSPGTVATILTPVGLNARAGPDPSADRLATLAQGARLEVLERRRVDGRDWLRVRSPGVRLEAWVLDDPELVIHREMAWHREPAAGYSNLFPAGWNLRSGNPALMSAPEAGLEAQSLAISSSPPGAPAPPAPTEPAREIRQEGPLEVSGKTAYLTVFRLDGGGYELVVRVAFEKASYLFDYRERGEEVHTALFRALLASVVVR